MNNELYDFNYFCKILDSFSIHISDDSSVIKQLNKRWYTSISECNIDYSIYNEDDYFIDLWNCWKFYSSKYIKLIHKNVFLSDTISSYNSLCDLGCGFGFSTVQLKRLFPSLDIYGTNIYESKQYAIASFLGNTENFNIYQSVQNNTNIIFASEYFEHFYEPIDHLVNILNIANPSILIVANSFGAESIGHFKEYKYCNNIMNPLMTSKRFNKTIIEHGFNKIDTGFWNNRPMVYLRG